MLNSIKSVFSSGETSSTVSQYTILGHTLWLDTTLVALRDSSGEVNSVMGIARDISLRKIAEENSSRMGQILDDSLNEIFLFDAEDLHFIQVNRGASKNLGYNLLELNEMTPIDIKPEFTWDEFEELILPLRSGDSEKLQFETVHKRKDGSTYPVEVHLQLISSDTTQIFTAIILDVTERKKTENELKQAYEKTLEG